MMGIMNWFKNIFNKEESQRIFMDYASATPVLQEVRQVMEKYFSQDFYNSSAIYEEGLKVKKEVEEYRTQVARILSAGSKEVVFTAGGTEADNLAILGVFEEAKKTIEKPHLIISAIEHSAVVRVAEECVRRGGELSIAPVNEEGIVLFEALSKLIKKNTVLVSIGYANSEIGVVQPISKFGRLVKEIRKKNGGSYPLLHSDASAAPNCLNVNLESLQCDLLSLDGSKIYGPKGVGALIMRRGVKLHPLVFGGNQEKGLRAGTLNPALIAGFTKALEIAERDRVTESLRLEILRRDFVETITRSLPHLVINGSVQNHLPNIVSVSVPGLLGEFILLKLDKEGIAVSVGTACSLDEKESGSPIIKALGKDELKESTLRFSFGRQTTKKDIFKAAKIFCLSIQNMLKSPHDAAI
jgi:cysteine desulfurase